MPQLSFIGKTAIITGAGGALGRAYALDLAKRGSNLLINDVGATLIGAIQDNAKEPSNAEKLVAEINASGGKAVFNNNNVTHEGDKIVEHALRSFGRCDVLINNAGNLRDKSFAKLTKEDWQSVIDVHLNGTFQLCHAAWPFFQQQQYGRIINIGSGAGLYGNFGQANYSSAKMGILGLTQTLAKEGAKCNIHVNCVVPVASSRMTETVLPPEVLKMLHPSLVAPIVTYLAHESCKNSGDCYEVGGGWFSKVRIQRSAGRSLGGSPQSISAEMIAQNIASIEDFSDPAYPVNAGDAFPALMSAREKEKAVSSTIDSSKVTQTPSSAAVSVGVVKLNSDAGFIALRSLLHDDKQKASEISAKCRTRVVFCLIDEKKKPIKYWYMDLKSEKPTVHEISREEIETLKPNAVLSCSDKTIFNLFTGSTGPEMAYMRGLLKVEGSMGAALKLKSLLELSATLKL